MCFLAAAAGYFHHGEVGLVFHNKNLRFGQRYVSGIRLPWDASACIETKTPFQLNIIAL